MHPSEPHAAAIEAWSLDAFGDAVDTFDVRLAGATTATIVPFTTVAGQALVAKIYDRGIDGVGPDDVRRDMAAMHAAVQVDIAAPRLLDGDPDGHRLNFPALVMSRLPGAPLAFGGDDPEHWVDGLAAALIDIGRAPLPDLALPHYVSWLPDTIEPPKWSTNPALWNDIAAVLAAPLPASAPRLIHRDFHPLNVLWADGEPTGSVDWVNGCLGPIESDIASCRVNIALADRRYDGVALADRFLEQCLAAGLPWHPAWDLDFIAGVADRPEMFEIARDLGADVTFDSVCSALEAMAGNARAAVAR